MAAGSMRPSWTTTGWRSAPWTRRALALPSSPYRSENPLVTMAHRTGKRLGTVRLEAKDALGVRRPLRGMAGQIVELPKGHRCSLDHFWLI